MDRRKRAADAYRRVRDGRAGTEADEEQAARKDDEPRRTARKDDTSQPAAGEAAATPGEARSNPGDPAAGEAAATPGEARSNPGEPAAPHEGDPAAPHEGFEKTGPSRAASITAEALAGLLEGSGAERAARLLIALGTERAAQVMRHLSEDEVEAIAAAIVEVRGVSRSEQESLLAELAQGPAEAPPRGGPEVARSILIAAFGEEEGGRRFFRSIPDAPAHHFAFLNELEPHQLHALVKDESDAAAALILAHVDRSLAAHALGRLEMDRRARIARRIARMGKLSHDVVTRVEEAIREKIRRQGHQVTQGVDGPTTLAAILRHLAPSEGDQIIADLREASMDLGESVREKLYTSEMILRLSDRHLADLLRDFSDQEIALFLKGKEQSLRERVLRAVSARRGESISEEYAHLGAQRRDDVDEITREVLNRMRELEEDGSILVPREGDHYI